jgi:hypothetical protein
MRTNNPSLLSPAQDSQLATRGCTERLVLPAACQQVSAAHALCITWIDDFTCDYSCFL